MDFLALNAVKTSVCDEIDEEKNGDLLKANETLLPLSESAHSLNKD